jgi:SAM-dependent methyltransferase
MLCVAYGVVYDYIFERFRPYQDLLKEVRRLVEITTLETVDRREVRVLDLGCGLGNFTLSLAEAGFSVIGLDTYGALVELAREKRRVKRLANLAFRYGDLAEGASFREGTFDHIVTIHSLYVHPAPERLLREAYRVLKPGGHAIFVNHTRQVGLWLTIRDFTRREGLEAALRSLVWLVPNAIFEVARRRIGPHYWSETEFRARLQEAGFTVLAMRRTFLSGASLLVWARKSED